MTVRLTGTSLSIADVVTVARRLEPVALSSEARQAIEASNRTLAGLIEQRVPIYGLTLGCGELDSSAVGERSQAIHQRNLVLSHACGVGEAMLPDQVRAMMLSRLNNLARGMSGISPSTVDALVAMINANIVPVVPTMGSVGASDLVPLSHMSAALIGEGQVLFKGVVVRAESAFKHAGLEPACLTGRDGLALINGLGQTNGVAALALSDARRILDLSVCASLLTSTLLYPDSDREQERTTALKNHASAHRLAKRFRELTGSRQKGDVRSPLSLRFLPYTTAVAFDSLATAEKVVEEELNAVVDNPLVSPDGWYTNNSGNMSGHRIGQVLDQFGLTLIAIAVAAERRISQLLRKDPVRNLPPYLIHPLAQPGTNYGLMITHYTAASLVASLRTTSLSSSIQSMSTGGTFEDLTPMSNYSAYHVTWITRQLEAIISIELLAALQGFDCLGEEPPPGLQELAAAVREICPTVSDDRLIGNDLKNLQMAITGSRLPIPSIM